MAEVLAVPKWAVTVQRWGDEHLEVNVESNEAIIELIGR